MEGLGGVNQKGVAESKDEATAADVSSSCNCYLHSMEGVAGGRSEKVEELEQPQGELQGLDGVEQPQEQQQG